MRISMHCRTASAVAVSYKITIYGADHTVLKTGTGMFDLPASATVPIFFPFFFSGVASSSQAFLTIETDQIKWFSSQARSFLTVGSPTLLGTREAPRISATLTNPSTAVYANVKVIAVAFDGEGNVVAASQTVVPVV